MKKRVLSWLVIFWCFGGVALAGENWLEARFGKELKDAKGKAVAVESLKGKIVGVYFSAHWCPPCRSFTPKLVAFRDQNKKEFEVVFISADQDATAMQGYMEETKMKWPALPWRGEKAMGLMSEFKVNGIPMLIILGTDGQVLTMNGRGDVTSSPNNALKSWKKANQKNVGAPKKQKK